MRIGPYEIEGELGRGGMGVVHRGRAADGRPVAIKVLLDRQPDRLARFERERRLLESLGEANGFVPLLDAGSSPSGPYVVMPLLTGGTLRDRLDRGAQTIEATLELGRALARALGAAHALGVVHRDLKPENVLFDRAGRPLVADLGLAKHFDRDAARGGESLSRSGVFRGTAGYAPPEQLESSRRVGPAADVFALGAILYECLAGRPAFVGASVVEVLTRVATGRFERVARVRADAPAVLVAAIERALSADPSARPADGNELERALRDVVRPRRRPFAFVALALGLVGAGVPLASFLRGGAPTGSREPRPAATHDPAARGAAASASAIALADALSLAGATAASLGESARALAFAGTDPVRRAAALVARGSALGRAGDLAGALAAGEEALGLVPRSPAALSLHGVAALQLGDGDRAEQDFEQALTVDPRYARALVGRSAVRARRDPVGALADLDHALEGDPRSVEALRNRLVLRALSGNPKGALDDLERLRALGTDSALLCVTEGTARKLLKDMAGAHAAYRRAIELDPSEAQAWHYLGEARLAEGDLEGARAALEEAVRLRSGLAPAWILLAQVRIALRDFPGAAGAAGKALQLKPRSIEALASRSTALAELGDVNAAIADVDLALTIEPGSADLLWRRAMHRLRKGDAREAVADANLSIEKDPKAPAAYGVRAKARRALGDLAGEREDLLRSIELDPEGPGASYARARLAETD